MTNKVWDYTNHADFYINRPNYASTIIDQLIKYVGAKKGDSYLVADIGAGTANLTLMLLERGLACVAVEPNDDMRRVGKERTQGKNVTWVVGTGEDTTLPAKSVDWVTYGSSFNTMDRAKALKECARILKPKGFFTCMWNHRDLTDPVQQKVESYIEKEVKGYTRGTRREDQTEVIAQSKLFTPAHYLEGGQPVEQTPERYVDAWRSTRNLSAQAGEKFEAVLAGINGLVKDMKVLNLNYTTRSWTAQKLS